MVKRIIAGFGAALALAPMLPAQELQRFEIFGNYSYMLAAPSASGASNVSFSGGGGGGQFNFDRYVGFRTDIQTYGSSSWVPLSNAPALGNAVSSASMTTFLFGPTLSFPTRRFTVFADTMFGFGNTTGFVDPLRAVASNSGFIPSTGTQHPFVMAFGGGVDIPVSRHFAVRLAQADFVMFRYENPLTSNDQNNFRFQSGVVFRFGS